MSLTDPHDPRVFRRYVKLNADGTVAGIVDVEVSQTPTDVAKSVYVDVTEHAGQNLDTLKLSADLVTDQASAENYHADRVEELAAAQLGVAQGQAMKDASMAALQGAIKASLATTRAAEADVVK